MQIKDVSLEQGVITLNHTKNRKACVIPIPTSLNLILDSYIRLRNATAEETLLTLFSFYPSIKYTYDIICEKEKEGAFPPVIEKDFVERMIKEHKCLVCKTELIEHSSCENEVKKLLERLSFSSESIQILTKIKSELENLIDETKEYKAIRDKLLERKKLLS